MNKKIKIISLFFIILFIINCLISQVFADDYDELSEDISTINEQLVETIQTNSPSEEFPSINSKSAVVLDRNSNTILYGKKENEKRKMASTTKIMTSLIIIENCDLQEVVEISKKAAGTGGSTLGIKTGDKITVRDLLYGLMLKSRERYSRCIS